MNITGVNMTTSLHEKCSVREFCDTGAMDPEEFCERKHDCRKCANFTTNADCLDSDDYVTKYCEWTGTVYEITMVLFVAGGLLCQLATSVGLLRVGCKNSACDKDKWKIIHNNCPVPFNMRCAAVTCLEVEISFAVLKLFPSMYYCRTLACAKITHNCLMTLANFPFSLLEGLTLGEKVFQEQEDAEHRTEGRFVSTATKGAGLVLEFAYVLWDLGKQTSEALGAGTWIDIVLACGSDVLLCLFGCFVGCTKMGCCPSMEDLEEEEGGGGGRRKRRKRRKRREEEGGGGSW